MANGMCCPACGADDHYVLDKRAAQAAVRRRHRCRTCGERFTSYEEALTDAEVEDRRVRVISGAAPIWVSEAEWATLRSLVDKMSRSRTALDAGEDG